MRWEGSKRTKILCTMGPKNFNHDVVAQMHEAGMDGVRINTAYEDFPFYDAIVRTVRGIGDIPILLDLKGPEIRIKAGKDEAAQTGDVIVVGEGENLEFNYDIYEQLNVDDQVFIDDGKIRMVVVNADARRLRLRMTRGGLIQDAKGVNVPRKQLQVPSLSEKDMKGIAFARTHDLEYVALSYVRGRADIVNFKGFAYELSARIIAKIENVQGVDNFEAILAEADGVMVARGDLGVEMELEQIPLIQKSMVQRCNQEGKLGIVATEMLESMVHNPMPTRAEVSDVANAILDGADVVMLSGETAIGAYPVEAVATMTRIAREVEESVETKVREERFRDISSTISRSIWQIASTMPLDKIITMTRTGYTARMIARFKPRQPIIAVTANKMVRNQLALVYGVTAVHHDYEDKSDPILVVTQQLVADGVLDEDDNVLYTAGIRTAQQHASNLIEIHGVRELLEFGQTA